MQTCSEQPCSRKVVARGLCGTHYAYARRYGFSASQAKMDRSGPNAVNFGKRGAETSQWKGDAIGYRAAHLRLMRWRGQPSECSSCGATGPGRRYEWALRKDASRVLLDDFTSMRGRTFSPDPDDYVRLCNPCHHTYDHGGEVLACKGCGVTFTTTRGNQLFCTKKCTNGYYNRLR